MAPHEPSKTLEGRIGGLLAGQTLGVLATSDGGQPYTSLVGIAASEDLRQIVFATPRTTRKWANLRADSRASILVDNRSNEVADFREAMAVTIIGAARILRKNRRSRLYQLYLGRHGHLADFVAAPTTDLICLEVHSIYAVERFQHVTELHFRR